MGRAYKAPLREPELLERARDSGPSSMDLEIEVETGIDGVIREVVETAGAGIYTAPGDAKALAEAVRFLACHQQEREQMSRRGRLFVEQHFNRSRQSQQFVDLLQRLAANG